MSLVVKCPYADCGREVTVRAIQDGEPSVCNHCGRPFRLSESQRERVTATSEDTTQAADLPRSTSDRQPGHPTCLGRFQIRARLGAGAFGEVFRAYDPVLEREVALKVPRPGVLDSAKARARFLREPKAARTASSPEHRPRSTMQDRMATISTSPRPLSQETPFSTSSTRHHPTCIGRHKSSVTWPWPSIMPMAPE